MYMRQTPESRGALECEWLSLNSLLNADMELMSRVFELEFN